MQLTRMPLRASAAAWLVVRLIIAALTAAYPGARSEGRKPEIDEMLMTELPIERSIIGSAACVARTVAMMSTESPAAHAASSSPMPNPDVLLTSTSRPPSSAAASANIGAERGAIGNIACHGVRATSLSQRSRPSCARVRRRCARRSRHRRRSGGKRERNRASDAAAAAGDDDSLVREVERHRAPRASIRLREV